MLSIAIRSTATLCLLLVLGGVALAQSETVAPVAEKSKSVEASAPSMSAGGPVEEVRPSVYYLPDKNGRLQPVLDFTYQDFAELYRLKHQLERREDPPRYTLQRMTATGVAAADADAVELSIQLQVLTRVDGWVRVPLRLDQGVLRGDVQYKGSGKQFIEYAGDGAGYACWIQGTPDSQHELRLTMLVPIAAVGEEWHLRLFAPRATVSEMQLSVPLAAATGKVSDGATLAAATAAKDGATAFSVVGVCGDFSMVWRKANPRVAETPAVLEATAAVLTRFDGRSQGAEATLAVRSHGAAFDRFTVRLPPGMDLIVGPTNGYSITAIPTEPDDAADRRVEVRLQKKTVGPVEVRLNCHRDYNPLQSQAWCELAGFDVVGAARQWGTTAVAVGGDWQVLWGVSSEVRQTDQLPEALRKTDVVAAFEYATQPYLLSARLVPRKTRVSMDPKYVLLIDRDAVRLEGSLTYTVRGAKTAALDIAMPGWKVDEVGPDSLVAVDGVVQNGEVATVPLLQPSSGTLTIQLRAHRDIAADAKSLTVPLPKALNGTVGPASVAVVPADNVDLTPNIQAIEGLMRQRIAPPMRLPERQQEPLYYRGTGVPGVFAADFRILPQRITVGAAGQATFGDRVVEVEQRMSYSIAHEPVDRLTLAVPRDLAAPKRIQIFCDGRPLTMATSSDEPAGGIGASVAVRVALPSPRIGDCVLVLQYAVPITEPTPASPSSVVIPLPMPLDGQLVNNTMAVKASHILRVSPRKGDWTVVDRETTAANGAAGLLLNAAAAVSHVDFDLRWEADNTVDATIVDRAWIQSWVTAVGRQDRAVYQLATNRKEIDILFPAGAVIDHTLVDGKRVERRAVEEDRWAIPVAGQREGRRVVVELRYHFQDAGPRHGAIGIGFPQIGDNAWVRRMFWQLVLPTNEHLIVNPPGFTGEFQWNWQGYFWGREPTLDQEDLEPWAGAAPRDPLPERANVYLFSALGTMKGAEVHTASRSMIVLCASGAALVLGLLLIYLPAARHPATLLILGLGVAGGSIIAPEPALLLAQAAMLGLVLALFAGLLERSLSRRHRTIRIEPTSAILDPGSTRAPRYAMMTGSHASVDVAPTAPPQSLGNVDP